MLMHIEMKISWSGDAHVHYSDVIMSVMASQITSLTIVYSTVYSRCRSKKTSKLRVTGLFAGNSPVTGEFPAQRASNAENLMTSSCRSRCWLPTHCHLNNRTSSIRWKWYHILHVCRLLCRGRLGPGAHFTTWWRHQMETFSALLAICAWNSPVIGEFPAQRPVTRSFDVFFDLHLNKQLSKHSWCWWFETRSRPQ